MRIGVAYEICPNAIYRASDPIFAMTRRGHEVAWPDEDGKAQFARLLGCDIVHVYRRAGADTYRVLADVVRAGKPLIYDNDDDFSTLPKEAPQYKTHGGVQGFRMFQLMVKMARLAHTLTTTNELIAERYRAAGVANAVVIPNRISPFIERPTVAHDGIVIGWIAGTEHEADLAHIDVRGAIREIVAKHPSVRVHSVGINLRLPDRYTHEASRPFLELPGVTGGFDIAIAPLADLAFNRARSDIKLKEYAASGVPWLASPVGPYLGLGEAQGGRLVPNDDWFDALEALITNSSLRRQLGENGRAWAAQQTIDGVADLWEQVFTDAVASVRR